MVITGTPNREGNFEDKAGLYQDHSNMLCQTAQMVAADGGNSNRKTVEGIFSSVNQVRKSDQSLNCAW